jgi:hypothetical protein
MTMSERQMRRTIHRPGAIDVGSENGIGIKLKTGALATRDALRSSRRVVVYVWWGMCVGWWRQKLEKKKCTVAV